MQAAQISQTVVTARVLQIMCGYQKVMPTLLTQAGFDVMKLLPREQEINSDVSFPPLIQHATLQLLSTVPSGGFRWINQVKSCFDSRCTFKCK